MKKIRVGIIGCGAVAYRWYLSGLTKNVNKFYNVVKLCDIDPDKVKKASQDYNIKNYTTDYKEFNKTDIDLVVILTRHEDHFKQIKYFLNKGIHVYSEKPFCLNSKQGNELIKIAKRNKLTLGSAPQVMLSSRNKKVKKLLDKKIIGDISFIRASCSNLGPAGRNDTNYDPEWFYNESGSLWSLGIYGLTTLIWWFGDPKIVSSLQCISFPKREVLFGPFKGKKFAVTQVDNVTALFKFGNRTICMFDGSYSVTTPPKYEYEIHGEKGSIFVGGFGGPESIVLKLFDKKEKFVGPNDKCHINWTLAWGVEETIKSIINRVETPTNAKLNLTVIKTIERMNKSNNQQKN